MDFLEVARQVTENTQINVTSRDIQRIIGSIKKAQNPWEVIDFSDVPVPAVFETVKILEKSGIVEFSDSGLFLTNQGKDEAAQVHDVDDMSCAACEGRGISFNRFSNVVEKFLNIQEDRPKASHDFDQGYVTPNTTLARFVFAYERGDVEGKDIFILGDDDLVSIVLGLSGLTKNITVVEIDNRLADFIMQVGDKEGFEVNVHAFDLRNPLPEEYTGRYDTFFTDPPETLKAADAFIGRGIASLQGPGSAGYFGFTRREASLTKWFDLQNLLLKYKVVFTDIVHNFNEYVNWGYEQDTRAWQLAPVKVMPEKNWYRSAFYRIQTLEGCTGNSKDYGTENIYEDQESSTT